VLPHPFAAACQAARALLTPSRTATTCPRWTVPTSRHDTSMEYLAGVAVQLAMVLDLGYIVLAGNIDWTWTDDDEHWITVFSTTPPGFDASSPSKFNADAAAPIREQEGEEGCIRLCGSPALRGWQNKRERKGAGDESSGAKSTRHVTDLV
jgi:hypothetical protein